MRCAVLRWCPLWHARAARCKSGESAGWLPVCRLFLMLSSMPCADAAGAAGALADRGPGRGRRTQMFRHAKVHHPIGCKAAAQKRKNPRSRSLRGFFDPDL